MRLAGVVPGAISLRGPESICTGPAALAQAVHRPCRAHRSCTEQHRSRLAVRGSAPPASGGVGGGARSGAAGLRGQDDLDAQHLAALAQGKPDTLAFGESFSWEAVTQNLFG